LPLIGGNQRVAENRANHFLLPYSLFIRILPTFVAI
jgi:uncharacterized membrane protein